MLELDNRSARFAHPAALKSINQYATLDHSTYDTEEMMIRISYYASCLIAAAFLLSGCGKVATPFQSGPGDVVKAFYLAANEGKYSEAEDLLSEEAKATVKGTLGQMAGGFKGICDVNTRNGTLAKVDVVKEEIRGEGAKVVVNLTFKDGTKKNNDQNSLIKEKGGWRMALGE